MYGTLSRPSRTRQAGGAVNTGFTPSTNSTSAMEPLATSALHCARAGAGGASGAGAFTVAATSSCGVNEMPPGRSMLPASVLRALTANAVKIPLVCARAGPPAIATAGLSPTKRRAKRARRPAGTPVISSTRWGE